MTIRGEALPYLVILGIILSASMIFHLYIVAMIVLTLFIFTIFFFRDPERIFNGDEDILLSPADGRVILVKEENGNILVSIFMNIFNVHINRSPIKGEIVSISHFKGNYISAYKEKSSLENERVKWVVKGEREVEFVQIAGLVARRIHILKRIGDSVERGERVGVIAFGSRVDLTFKGEDYNLLIKEGSCVKAGLTPIAKRRK